MGILYCIALIAIIVVIFILKNIIWDKPQEEIYQLKRKIEYINLGHKEELLKIQMEHKKEINLLECEKEEFKKKINIECDKRIDVLRDEAAESKKQYDKIYAVFKELESNLTAIPYMAGMIADIETYGLEKLAQGLSWGRSQARLDKVKSIREIRKDAKAMVEKNKEAQYQLAYLMEIFPNLADVIECDYKRLPMIEVKELSDYDSARDYLSKEEYATLTSVEKNQLALDRYNNSHNKTKWQIGRDYEQYVGYQFRKKGYEVDNFGAYMGMEDLGRDIIAKGGNNVLIIQCKYWSSIKQIHEKHINQLYGTMVSYCIENQVSKENVRGVLITNINLSETAKKTRTS